MRANQNEQPGAKTKMSRQGQNKTSSQGQIWEIAAKELLSKNCDFQRAVENLVVKMKNTVEVKEFQCAGDGCDRIVIKGAKGRNQPYYNRWTPQNGPRLCHRHYKSFLKHEPEKAKLYGNKAEKHFITSRQGQN